MLQEQSSLGTIVVPAGVAWQRALAQRGDLPLYLEDASHPAPLGSSQKE